MLSDIFHCKITLLWYILEECVWEWAEGDCSKSCGGGIRKDRIGLRSGSAKCYENLKGRRERTTFCNTKKCSNDDYNNKGGYK